MAIGPICANMSMRLRPPPSCANAGVLDEHQPEPGNRNLSELTHLPNFHYCILRNP